MSFQKICSFVLSNQRHVLMKGKEKTNPKCIEQTRDAEKTHKRTDAKGVTLTNLARKCVDDSLFVLNFCSTTDWLLFARPIPSNSASVSIGPIIEDSGTK